MKKAIWKRVMSFVLVTALVFGMVQLDSIKAVVADDNTNVGTPTANIDTTSAFEPVLTFSVPSAGADVTTYTGKTTDLVLVVDLSGSMEENDKLAKVKTAAKQFVTDMFAGEAAAYTTISLVTYGKTTTVVASKLGKDAQQQLLDAIDAIDTAKVSYNRWGQMIDNEERGTNIQAGIRGAESVLDNSTATNKMIVLLSDGEPTFAYGTDWWGNEYIIGNGTTSSRSVTNGNIARATKAEATAAKNKGYIIYTISYGTEASTGLMSALSTSGTTYVSAETQEAISNTYAEIVKEAKSHIYAGTDAFIIATVEDVISAKELPADVTLGNNSVLNGKYPENVQFTAQSLIWKIGDLDGDIASDSIYLQVNGTAQELADKYGVDDNGNIIIPVSLSDAKLYYYKDGVWMSKDVNATSTQGTLNAAIPVKSYSIIYKAEQLDGSFVEVENSRVTGYAFVGDEIKATVKTAANLNLGTNYNDPDCNKSMTIGNEANVIEINATLKTATVKFFVKDNAGKYYEVENARVSNAKYGTQIGFGNIDVASYTTIDQANTDDGEAFFAENVHEFDGTWTLGGTETVVSTEGIVTVNGDASYYANYSNDVKPEFRTVTFVISDNENIVRTGEIDTEYDIPGDPAKNSDDTYKYGFMYWSLTAEGERAEVVERIPVQNTVYYAVFSKTEIPYTVTYLLETNGNPVDVQTYKYADTWTESGIAKAAAESIAAARTNAALDVEFTGWIASNDSIADNVVRGNVTLTATFNTEKIEYTVTYYDENGNYITSETVPGGSTQLTAVEAAKEATNDGYYTFKGWVEKNGTASLAELIGTGISKNIDVQAAFDYTAYKTGAINFYKFEYEVSDNEIIADSIIAINEITESLDETAAPAADKAVSAEEGAEFDNWYTKYEVTADENEVVSTASFKTEYTVITWKEFVEKFNNGEIEVGNYSFYPVFNEVEKPAEEVEEEKPVAEAEEEKPVEEPVEEKPVEKPVEEKPVEIKPAEEPVKNDPEPVVVPETSSTPVAPVTIVYTLTVKYVYEDGSEAAADVVKSLEPGEAYKVDSPAIEGYTADQAVVEGTMVVFDKTITVVYTKDAEPEEEIEIDPVIETPEAAPEEDDENEEIEEVEENEEEEEEEEIVIDPVVETPEGTPEDEIDLDDILTPEGLPQTGTASVVIFFGVGAACVILGATMIIKVRRREEEM